MAGVSLDTIQRHGRLGPYTDETLEAMKTNLLQLLTELSISKEEQTKILDECWHRYILFDFAHYLLGDNWSASALSLDENTANYRKKIAPKLDSGQLPTPQEIQTFYEKAGIMTQEKQELLEDYEHYRQYKAFRRPDIWKQRRDWLTRSKTTKS